MGTAECEFPDIMYINTEDVSVASKIKIRKFKAMYRNYSKKKKLSPFCRDYWCVEWLTRNGGYAILDIKLKFSSSLKSNLYVSSCFLLCLIV